MGIPFLNSTWEHFVPCPYLSRWSAFNLHFGNCSHKGKVKILLLSIIWKTTDIWTSKELIHLKRLEPIRWGLSGSMAFQAYLSFLCPVSESTGCPHSASQSALWTCNWAPLGPHAHVSLPSLLCWFAFLSPAPVSACSHGMRHSVGRGQTPDPAVNLPARRGPSPHFPFSGSTGSLPSPALSRKVGSLLCPPGLLGS